MPDDGTRGLSPLFTKLSELGQKLIDFHLLKVYFEKSIAGFPEQKNIDLKISEVEYKPLNPFDKGGPVEFID